MFVRLGRRPYFSPGILEYLNMSEPSAVLSPPEAKLLETSYLELKLKR
jgi:hypothetical protein